MGKKRLIAFSLIMVLLLMFIMSSTVFATGFAKDYIEPFDAEKNYVTIDDNVPVRKSPNKYSEIITYWDTDMYAKGKVVVNKTSLKKWLQVKLEDGAEAFVYMGHFSEHVHSFIEIGAYYDSYNPDRHSVVEVCDCGWNRILRWNGSEYTSCKEFDVICQWFYREKNPLVEIIDYIVFEKGIEFTCNPEVIATSEGISGPICAALLFYTGVSSVVDINENLSEENYIDIIFNVSDITVGLGDLLELAEAGSAVKHTAFYKTAEQVSDYKTKTDLLQSISSIIKGMFAQEGKMVYYPYVELCRSEATTENYVTGPQGILQVGEVFKLQGFIREGEYPFVSVTTKIKDYYGKEVYSYTDYIKNSVYEFYKSSCDNAMLFNQLPEGRYKFEVYVTEEKCGYESTNLVYTSWFDEVIN